MPDTPELHDEAPGSSLEAISALCDRTAALEDMLGAIADGLKGLRPSGAVPGLGFHAPPAHGTVPTDRLHEDTPDFMLIRAALKALDVRGGEPVPAHRAELARTYLSSILEGRTNER